MANRLPREGKEEPKDALASWIVEHCEQWENHRNNNYRAKWEEYYRLWRGIHQEQDKMYKMERSKLISPALSQAIEVTVSELEEALFSKKKWLDIDRSTYDDPQIAQAMDQYLDKLLKEFDLNKVPASVAEIMLNGAIYGTGIGKVVIEMRTTRVPQMAQDGTLTSVPQKYPCVKLVPIDPKEFVIDPLARSIDEAMGCAHITYQSRTNVVAKQKKGIYKDVDLGAFTDDMNIGALGEIAQTKKEEHVKITEYHGKVPRAMLDPIGMMLEDDLQMPADEEEDDSGMIEAIVTIANDSVILRSVKNPFFMQDRSIIAYQHDRVPNRFWGRGIAEKGYNPQKALDAELRGRIDAMAFAVRPMVGINASLVPRELNNKFSVYAGKTIFTNGRPSEAIEPLNFNPPPPSSFNQSGDLERMVEMGTGAFQAAAPGNVNPRNQTAGGMGMIVSASIKRNKRTLLNIETNLLDEFVKKSAYRYMQADPETYPIVDLRFVVNSSLGIMAREVETQQIVQLLNTTEPNSTSYWMLIKSLYQLSTISNRDEMMPIIDAKLQESLQPSPDPRAMAAMKQAETQQFIAENDAVFKKTKGVLNLVEAEKKEAETGNVRQQGFLDEIGTLNELMKSQNDKEQEAQQAVSALAQPNQGV